MCHLGIFSIITKFPINLIHFSSLNPTSFDDLHACSRISATIDSIKWQESYLQCLSGSLPVHHGCSYAKGSVSALRQIII
jgi:hypothetical protein